MSNTNIGEAYLQIRPSMEGIQGELEGAMGEAGSRGGASFSSAFASGLGAVTAAASAAVTAAAAGVTALAKESVSAFADYEQLVGGVETLYGDQFDTVMENASRAYETAGLSANEYMETVNGFAASLTNSLGEEYAWQAANYANEAVIAMADNANRMGTSMESIQNAYAGFAKGNFTMLDNLKLGYGGTKEEMERLLRDAEQLEGYMEGSLDINSFADITEAIQIVQDNLGITGTTAEEAAETISGSLAMTKSAWTNLVAGMANPDADLGMLIDNFVQSGLTALDNLMPTIQQALTGIAQVITQITPILVQMLPGLIQTLVPPLIDAAIQLVNALVQALPDIISILLDQLPAMFDLIVNTILTMLPMIIDLGFQFIMALANGLIENLPTLIPAIVDVVLSIVDKLTDPDTLVMLIDAAIQLILALAEGLIRAIPKLIEKAPEIVMNLVEAVIKAAPKILEAGAELIFKLIEGILMVVGQLVTTGADLVQSVKDGFWEKVEGAKEWGKDLVQNFIDGIKAKWENLKSTVTDLASTIKSLLGFSEPEEGPLSNFHTYAPDMMELFASGIRQNLGLITDAMGMVTGTIATDFTAAQIAPNSYSEIANPYENLNDALGANSGAQGDIVIPVYIGQERLDTIILNAQQRHALVSGGR